MNLKLIVVLKKVYGSKDMNEVRVNLMHFIPRVKEYIEIRGSKYCVIKVTHCYGSDSHHIELLVSEII